MVREERAGVGTGLSAHSAVVARTAFGRVLIAGEGGGRWAGRVFLWASWAFPDRRTSPPSLPRSTSRQSMLSARAEHTSPRGAAAHYHRALECYLDCQTAPSMSACVRNLRAALTDRWRSGRYTSSWALPVRRRLHRTSLPRRSGLFPVTVRSVFHASAQVCRSMPHPCGAGCDSTERSRSRRRSSSRGRARARSCARSQPLPSSCSCRFVP
jgi:hypothetical protein